MIKNGFILNPFTELMPDYKICPFSNRDIFKNRFLPSSDLIEDYFSSRFHYKIYTYTFNGREAINIALQQYKLNSEDIVTIFTTSGNTYISNCVTKEIEKFCKWSRKLEINTKIIFVNHEFGYPYTQLLDLKQYHLPIIEDCAHSFLSKDLDDMIGTIGDYVIYSFPKIFPLQIGGLLVSNIDCKLNSSNFLGIEESRYIKNVLSDYISYEKEIAHNRRQNYLYLSQEFKAIGLNERFSLDPNIIPGVFMFRKGTRQFELAELKKHFNLHGIQCSVFYGEESFFLPVHQSLNESDLSYFVEVMKYFLMQQCHEIF